METTTLSFRKFVLILSLFTVFSASGQLNSGYFGAFHGVEIRVGGVPAVNRVSNLKEDGDSYITSRRAQLMRMNYKFNYSFIAARHVELIAGYEYTSVLTPNHFYLANVPSQNKELLEDIKFNKHGINLEMRYYRNGSIATAGKYFGFGINYSRLQVPDSVAVIHGNLGSVASNSGFFNKKYVVNTMDTTYISRVSYHHYQSFTITAAIGRNYPITEHLLLNFNARIKVLGVYWNGQSQYMFANRLGQGIFEWIDGYNAVPIDQESSIGDLVFRPSAMYAAMLGYNRLQLEVGLKYYF